MTIHLVIVESPYGGSEENLNYARDACLDCIERDETPFASHLFCPQFLNEYKLDERELGIQLGYHWGLAAIKAANVASTDDHPIFTAKVVFYLDKGWSPGMEAAFEYYSHHNIPFEIRRLSPVEEKKHETTSIE